jgi:hypothetical protein
MYGAFLLHSDVPSSGTIVRPIWTFSQKGCDTFKARECMNGKQLVCMGHTFEDTYAPCIEQHCIRLFVAFTAQLGFLIEDGDMVNVYAHADAEGPTIYLIIDDVYQSWYYKRHGRDLHLGSYAPLLKAIEGHPEAGKCWSKHFDARCSAPLAMKSVFTERTIYRCDDAVCMGSTLMIRQVDDIVCGAATSSDRNAVLDGIGSHVNFKRSASLTKLFYATDIDQCAQYIRVFAQSYIESCLTKLGWETRSASSSLMVPLTLAVLKSLSTPPGTLDPAGIVAMADKHGFAYRTMTGMLIFAVQIGRFDIAPAVCILCKFNERPSDAHFQAAKNVMKYLRATSHCSLI